jgi:hypothetical protein
MGLACSGFQVLVHDKLVVPVGMPAAKISSDTLLGFETTSPLFFDCGWRGLLLPHFGGGVWCLICG